MVKRKYLAISLIILCSAVCLPTSYAGAYLPEPGHYKYSTSFLFLDRMSQKKRDYLASTFAKIHDRIHELRVACQPFRGHIFQGSLHLLQTQLEQGIQWSNALLFCYKTPRCIQR